MSNNGLIVEEIIRSVPLKDMSLVRLSDGRYASFIGIGEVGLPLLEHPDIDVYVDLDIAMKEFDDIILENQPCFLPKNGDFAESGVFQSGEAKKSEEIDIDALLCSPAVHDWLKARVLEIEKKDIVDLIHDTELFLRILNQRFIKSLEGH